MSIKAEIVAIGSELLLGQIIDTNSAWIANKLSDVGINLYHKSVVGDNQHRMFSTLDTAFQRSDIVITSGGIGPTKDDITREVVAEVVGRQLVRDQELLNDIEKRFRSRGLIMSANNEKQADIPQGSIPVFNPNGTAPSFIVEEEGKVIISLPGVPSELKWLFENEILPDLVKKFNLSEIIISRVLKVSRMGESMVDDKIGFLIEESQNPTIGLLAHPGQVDVRITAKAKNNEQALNLINPMEDKIRKILGDYIFATDDQNISDTIQDVFKEKGQTIGVYEDITSGLISQELQISSANSFIGSVVLGKNNQTNDINSQFSHQLSSEKSNDPVDFTKRAARFVMEFFGTDISLAVHGVIKDSNKVDNLGNGTTFFVVTDGENIVSDQYNIAGFGLSDRKRLTIYALDTLRRFLLKS